MAKKTTARAPKKLAIEHLDRMQAAIRQSEGGDWPTIEAALVQMEPKMKFVPLKAGGWTVRMAGIEASTAVDETPGKRQALSNWAAAARRAILKATA